MSDIKPSKESRVDPKIQERIDAILELKRLLKSSKASKTEKERSEKGQRQSDANDGQSQISEGSRKGGQRGGRKRGSSSRLSTSGSKWREVVAKVESAESAESPSVKAQFRDFRANPTTERQELTKFMMSRLAATCWDDPEFTALSPAVKRGKEQRRRSKLESEENINLTNLMLLEAGEGSSPEKEEEKKAAPRKRRASSTQSEPGNRQRVKESDMPRSSQSAVIVADSSSTVQTENHSYKSAKSSKTSKSRTSRSSRAKLEDSKSRSSLTGSKKLREQKDKKRSSVLRRKSPSRTKPAAAGRGRKSSKGGCSVM